jgi:hypothetical protein
VRRNDPGPCLLQLPFATADERIGGANGRTGMEG